MNYILSSIVLLVTTIIIIYLFSIDNNIDKFKNIIIETFSTIKSTKLNYLNVDDKKSLEFAILENIQIIGFKLQDNLFVEHTHTITINFIPIQNDLFVGRYTMFGKNGNFYIDKPMLDKKSSDKILSDKKSSDKKLSDKKSSDKKLSDKKLSNKKIFKKQNIMSEVRDLNTVTDILDMIPDIIHLSSDVEENTERVTTTSLKNHYA